ncbi:hypothetical protein ACTA71_000279 [Dictyostelium dimigraforme]
MPKASIWLPAEDNFIKTELLKKPSLPPQPKQQPDDNEEESSDSDSSEYEENPLPMILIKHTLRVKINDPIVLPLEDGSFKLIFGNPPFDIEIVEVKYLGDDGISNMIVSHLRPLPSTFSTTQQLNNKRYQGCKTIIQKELLYFSITVTPKVTEKVNLDDWVDS